MTKTKRASNDVIKTPDNKTKKLGNHTNIKGEFG